MLGLGGSLAAGGSVLDSKALIASYDFSGLGSSMNAGGNYTGSELPAGWVVTYDGSTILCYGSTVTDVDAQYQGDAHTRGWLVGFDTTASSSTCLLYTSPSPRDS